MKTTLILTLAATIVSGTATLSTAAHAGNGVKLYFNGPLGSFIARPSKGHGLNSSYAAAKKAQKGAAAYAARSEKDEAKTFGTAKHSKKADTAANASTTSSKISNDTSNEIESAENGPTGSKALMQTETTQVAAAEQPASAPAVSATTSAAEPYGPPAPTETAVETPKAAEATVAEVKADEPKTSTKSEDDSEKCKKFIPAVGVTISVGC
jgi:hypothetical protein